MKVRLMLVLCAVLALTVGVATATAGGGNSDSAHACQHGGWQHLVRSDGTKFKNQGDCVSYVAQGGTVQPACIPGSENFSEDAEFSTPTTFAGGTIDTPYGTDPFGPGGVQIQGTSWFGSFPDGTHLIFTGLGLNSFQLTFTGPVGSMQLDAEADNLGTFTQTLTAYDAANNVVGSADASSPVVATLSVSSATNNIKYFTIATDDPLFFGVGFTNIVWGCN